MANGLAQVLDSQGIINNMKMKLNQTSKEDMPLICPVRFGGLE
jgi:hypothetical protein